MRYYTKEWYELMQSVGLKDDFSKIPDGEYTAADIRKLYEKKLKREIAEDRRNYDLPPFFLPIDDLLTEETFDPEDWIRVDEETGKVQRPSSAREVRESLEAEYQQAQEEFEQRPPFDPSETIEMFREIYRSNLRTCRNNYPDWLVQSVDHHLLALGYLPETIWKRYRRELRDKEKRWNAINRSAKRALARQHIPEMMEEAMKLHDASLLSLRKKGENLVMIVAKDGEWPDDETPYRRVTFSDAKVLELEKGLRARRYRENGIWRSNVSFLYHEIYEKDGIYEVHVMFWAGMDLRYLTVRCGGISFEDGIAFGEESGQAAETTKE